MICETMIDAEHDEKYVNERLIDGGVNLNVQGLTGTWGAVGIEMLKFEAKKGDFAKIWQKLGGLYSPLALPSMS